MWLNELILVWNRNGESASSWKMPHWMFTAAKSFFPLRSISLSCFQSLPWWTLWFCLISCTFFDFILSGFARPYRRPFLSSLHTLRMCWSMYCRSPVLIFFLSWNQFCFSGNSPRWWILHRHGLAFSNLVFFSVLLLLLFTHYSFSHQR